MSRDIFIKILEQLRGCTHHLRFHVLGEPLVHPDLGLFLELCHEHGYRVTITTNGVLIDRAGLLLLAQPALRQVNFSLHCAESNKVLFSPDAYLGNIFCFIDEARKNKNIHISLRLWNAGNTADQEKNFYILHSIEKKFGLAYSLKQQLTGQAKIKLADAVFLNQAEHFLWPDINGKDFGGHGFCLGLRDHIAVLVDGTVVPCCLDSEGVINLGNINKNPFSAIVTGSRARNLYDGFSRRAAVEPLCRRCGYRLRFTRLPP